MNMSANRVPNATCEHCGKPYYRRPSHTNSRHCSMACRLVAKHTPAVTRTCRHCGRSFSTNPAKPADYCSVSCFNSATKRRPETICPMCGRSFHATNADQVCCSRTCANLARQKQVTRECLTCGRSFSRPASLAGPYCSRECAQQAQDQKVTLTCIVCGAEFRVSPVETRRNRQCCSETCARTIRPPNRRFRDKLAEGRRTDIEARVEQALIALGVPYEWEHRFGRYWVDFYLLETRIALECDEPYWHDAERDARKDAYIRERYDVEVVRLTSEQINGDIERLLARRLR